MVSYQTNMQMNDELAALFSRNLTFNSEIQPQTPETAPAPAPVQQQPQGEELPKPIIYSVSQHYTHSAHVVRTQQQQQQQPPPRPSSEPPQSDAILAEDILRNYNVNIASLTPSQMQLFKTADDSQKLRLIQLWSIYPPETSADIPSLAWSSTSVEHEEQLARMRHDRSNQQQNDNASSAPVQAQNGTWAQSQSQSEMEPYMLSGYEELMRRENERQARDDQPRSTYTHYGGSSYTSATDPVYMGPDYSRLQQQQQQQQELVMANQYGALQGFRYEGDAMDVM